MLDLTDFAVQERPEGNLMVAISRPWYNCSYTMVAKPIKSLELHYTMMQFLINYTILYYTILYYTILYYTILYYTILYYTILYYTILYYTIYVGHAFPFVVVVVVVFVLFCFGLVLFCFVFHYFEHSKETEWQFDISLKF